MKINYNNCYNPFFKKKIKKIFLITSQKINFTNFSVNITFANKKQILQLNKVYRNINKSTDVLSFPLVDFNNEQNVKETNPKSKLLDIGDIVICKKIAKVQAKNIGNSTCNELCFLALHGLLHLFGYDHTNFEQEEKMTAMQKEILARLKKEYK
ncbi:MAG: rRNA maturation RNase YbeY [Clostridia bacterium]